MITQRRDLARSKLWVVKVGTAVLTSNGAILQPGVIAAIAQQVSKLKSLGINVVLVSSGSIAAGVGKLGLNKRPDRLNQLQAAAAVGQAALVKVYDDEFSNWGTNVAQVLLTHSDVANRRRYLNARNTLQALLKMGVMTIVNENDTVATDEICFGDNDNLAALVANMIEADALILLTDQEGLYSADPRNDEQAQLILQGHVGDERLMGMASGGGRLGRGGMKTKLSAAEKAAHSGAATIIANGNNKRVLLDLAAGKELGTLLCPQNRLSSRKQWMAGRMHSEGELVIDDGARDVILGSGKSLLAVGVLNVTGEFARGSLVTCITVDGTEIARGLINYSSIEVDLLKGKQSEHFADLLTYVGDRELIHRDNLVVL